MERKHECHYHWPNLITLHHLLGSYNSDTEMAETVQISNIEFIFTFSSTRKNPDNTLLCMLFINRNSQ